MGAVDFHNHLIPGVDDGAQTTEDVVSALSNFKQDGVTTFIATPHVDGGLTTRNELLVERLDEIDAAFVTLQRCAEQADMRVERGVELLLDVPDPDLSDARLRLAGGPFFLMEFPYMAVPPQSVRAVRSLSASQYQPIIAHPERYHNLVGTLELALEWKQNGAFLQVNGGSLLGRYGNEPRETALELLRRGWVDYICSDYHARGSTLVAEYRDVLQKAGAEQAQLLMETNPTRMLNGQPPIPVPPLEIKRSMWGRVSALFRS
jgi:protein-tyrosine phosphatase